MARSGAAASAVVLLVIMALVQGSTAKSYVVGGPVGWQLDTLHDRNLYQNWADSNKPYFQIDFLEFNWIDPDSVLQVSLADFNACNKSNPIQKWAGNFGGSITNMVFSLLGHQFSTVYFISGFEDNCILGQKFSVDVLQLQ